MDTSNGSDHHHYQNKQIPQGPEDLLFSFQTAGNEFCQLIAPDEIYQGCQNADRQNGCCPLDFPAFFIIHILEKIPQRHKYSCCQSAKYKSASYLLVAVEMHPCTTSPVADEFKAIVLPSALGACAVRM